MAPVRRALSWIFPFLRPETPLYLVAFLTIAVIIILILIVVWATFKPGIPTSEDIFTTFTLKNYEYVFSSGATAPAAARTVGLAIGTMVVSLFFGVPMAWLVHRTTVPFKEVFTTLMFIHVLLPGFVRVMGWIMLISPEIGIVNEAIRAVMPSRCGQMQTV